MRFLTARELDLLLNRQGLFLLPRMVAARPAQAGPRAPRRELEAEPEAGSEACPPGGQVMPA